MPLIRVRESQVAIEAYEVVAELATAEVVEDRDEEEKGIQDQIRRDQAGTDLHFTCHNDIEWHQMILNDIE